MTTKTPLLRLRVASMILAACLLMTTTGCIGFLANMLHAGLGGMNPAQFDGLVGRRVAVVAVSDSSSFGPTTAAEEIARQIEKTIEENVKEIQIIDQQAVAEWMDRNDWNQIDYQELGKGIGAESVVAIDIGTFSLHDGKTLFRGRSDIELRVYDVTDAGRVVFEDAPPQLVYPAAAGLHRTDTTEANFRRVFIRVVASRIARYFYAYDATLDFGQDAMLLGNPT